MAPWRSHRRGPLRALAVAGLFGLLAGTMVPERYETPLTVACGLLLVSAHQWNWHRLHRHLHVQVAQQVL